jgi:hypothetical protein
VICSLRVLPDRDPRRLIRLNLLKISHDTPQFPGNCSIRSSQPQKPGFPIPGNCKGNHVIGIPDLLMTTVKLSFDSIGLLWAEPPLQRTHPLLDLAPRISRQKIHNRCRHRRRETGKIRLHIPSLR